MIADSGAKTGYLLGVRQRKLWWWRVERKLLCEEIHHWFYREAAEEHNRETEHHFQKSNTYREEGCSYIVASINELHVSHTNKMYGIWTDRKSMETLVHTFITCRLDQCYSLLVVCWIHYQVNYSEYRTSELDKSLWPINANTYLQSSMSCITCSYLSNTGSSTKSTSWLTNVSMERHLYIFSNSFMLTVLLGPGELVQEHQE